MNKKLLLGILPHLAAVAVFVLLSSVYFSPAWKGFELRQGDIDHWRGMSKEVSDYRLLYNGDPLWTNSMFGGMPAYQISTEHKANILRPVMQAMKLGLPGPVGVLFLCMLGFYIFALCLRINPWLGIAGAVAFGFSTINILYLGAGHAAKVNAIAFMPPVLGGLILAFRGRAVLGSAVFMLFLGLQITANHLQMTYYLAILCAAVAVAEAIRLILAKSWRSLAVSSFLLAAGAAVAVLPAMSNLLTTAEYSRYTTRGSTELTIEPEGSEAKTDRSSGLDTDYILDYNFAPGEQWSLFIPNAKGGQTAALGQNKEAMKKVKREFRENIARENQYWGAQRFTGGAFYFGAAVMVLFVIGLVLVRDVIRWPFLIVSLIALGLSAKNLTGLNQFFIDSFPLYNKFRDSKMILVLIQLMAPAMAMLLIQQSLRNELWTRSKKYVLGAIAAVAVIAIAVVARPEFTGDFLSPEDAERFSAYSEQAGGDSEQLLQIDAYKNNLIAVRTAIFREDASRSLLFGMLGIGIVLLAYFRKMRELPAGLLLIALIAVDLWGVDRRYLNTEKVKGGYESFVRSDDKIIPYKPATADFAILSYEEDRAENAVALRNDLREAIADAPAYRAVKNKELLDHAATFGALNLATNYRVLNLANPFNDAATSYYHKSIGGYHGAKLKSYQEMIDFHLTPEIGMVTDSLRRQNPVAGLAQADVLNMLNTRYVIYNREAPPVINPYAFGNAWFVSQIVSAPDANGEILALDTLDLRTGAVVRETDLSALNAAPDSTASVTLSEYAPNLLRYECNSATGGVIVFSEIWYPEGWVCRVDGTEVQAVRANYILRSVQVPSGEHTIEWSFEPAVWHTGNTLSTAGSVLMLLLLFGTAFAEWRSRKNAGNESA
jgi:hypothetical protein